MTTRRVNLERLLDWSQRSGVTFAVRFDDAQLEPGSELTESHFWDDGRRTDEAVGGTSAVQIDYLLRNPRCGEQYGNRAYIVRGTPNIDACCNDPGETVLLDAHIVCEVEL